MVKVRVLWGCRQVFMTFGQVTELLHREPRTLYTLSFRVRTQCPVWRLQGVGGLEGVSSITRLM